MRKKRYTLGRVAFHTLFIMSAISFSTCNSSTEVTLPDEGLGPILESDMDNAIVKTDGTVWAWGENTTGLLADGTTHPSQMPKQIKALRNVIAIDFCEGAAVAADINGNIWFWGNRLIWEEAPGYDTTVLTPVKISFLHGTKQLQIRGPDIHLLREDGTVWQLNWDHNTPTRYLVPERIDGMDNIGMISNDLAVRNDGTLCEFPDRTEFWAETGGLDDDEIIGNVNVVQNIYMRWTIVLKADNTVWAWERNGSGNLGDGSYEDNPFPCKIDTLKEVISISAEGERCLALGNNGTVWFWALVCLDSGKDIEMCLNRPMKIEEIEDARMIFASPVGDLLFMKNDGTYWSYDLMTKEVRKVHS